MGFRENISGADKRLISEELMAVVQSEIRIATERKGLEDKDVAALMGVTKAYYSHIKGSRTQVMKFLEYIANILDCDVDIRFIPKSRKK